MAPGVVGPLSARTPRSRPAPRSWCRWRGRGFRCSPRHGCTGPRVGSPARSQARSCSTPRARPASRRAPPTRAGERRRRRWRRPRCRRSAGARRRAGSAGSRPPRCPSCRSPARRSRSASDGRAGRVRAGQHAGPRSIVGGEGRLGVVERGEVRPAVAAEGELLGTPSKFASSLLGIPGTLEGPGPAGVPHAAARRDRAPAGSSAVARLPAARRTPRRARRPPAAPGLWAEADRVLTRSSSVACRRRRSARGRDDGGIGEVLGFEHALGRRLVWQLLEGMVAVVVVAAFERPISIQQHRHVMVGVVATAPTGRWPGLGAGAPALATALRGGRPPRRASPAADTHAVVARPDRRYTGNSHSLHPLGQREVIQAGRIGRLGDLPLRRLQCELPICARPAARSRAGRGPCA